MKEFSDPMMFEYELASIADSMFAGRGRIHHKEPIGFGFDTWRLDYVLDLTQGGMSGRYLFEFKYSNYPTIPEAMIRTLLARFSSLKSANSKMEFTCLIVTNGKTSVEQSQLPPYVKIIAEVKNGEQWRKRLREMFGGQ